jgi:hypothetical protein
MVVVFVVMARGGSTGHYVVAQMFEVMGLLLVGCSPRFVLLQLCATQRYVS